MVVGEVTQALITYEVKLTSEATSNLYQEDPATDPHIYERAAPGREALSPGETKTGAGKGVAV